MIKLMILQQSDYYATYEYTNITSLFNLSYSTATYKEAMKTILCYLGIIFMIEINVLVQGPSNREIYNHQGDLNQTRHKLSECPS